MHILQYLLRKKVFPVFSIGVIILSFASQACRLSAKVNSLPPPDGNCAITVNWNGIVPGKSTRQDVKDILGEPQSQGKERFGDSFIAYYAYQVDQGTVADYVQDRVFFRTDGVVDWVEEIVADRHGTYQTLLETVNLLGSTLDVAYNNNNYNPANKGQMDVLGGPDQLYVWSNCGLVLDTLPHCSSITNLDYENEDSVNTNLSFRFSSPYHIGGEPEPDVRNIVLMRFLFPPTTYEAFKDSYMFKIPYDIWGDYIRELNCYGN